MSDRAEQLAVKLEQVTGDATKTIEEISDEQWRETCEAEGWSVAATAHHIAGGYAPISGFIQAVASGQKPPALPIDQLDQGNAEHAKQFADCSKDETLNMLREGSGGAIQAVRAMTDVQLDISGDFIAGAPPMTAEQMTQNVLIGHAAGHLESLKAIA